MKTLMVRSVLILAAVIFSSEAFAGRYKDGGGSCYWDPNDSGPNQCSPSSPSSPPPAPTYSDPTGPGTNTMVKGQNLYTNQYLVSSGGSCVFANQGDNNVVWYLNGRPFDATSFYGGFSFGQQSVVAFQSDGNFVLYNGSRAIGATSFGTPYYQSATKAVLDDNCKIHFYNGSGAEFFVWN